MRYRVPVELSVSCPARSLGNVSYYSLLSSAGIVEVDLALSRRLLRWFGRHDGECLLGWKVMDEWMGEGCCSAAVRFR